MRNLQRLLGAFLFLATFASVSRAYDNANFYKVPNLHRTQFTGLYDDLEKYDAMEWLTKLDATFSIGDAKSCWDKNGVSTTLLNQTGPYNMLYVIENVEKFPTDQNILDAYNFIADGRIEHEGSGSTFGQLQFSGEFDTHEFNFYLRQNIVAGLFIEAHAPLRDIKIHNISYADLSPEPSAENPIYNTNTGEWKIFLNSLDNLLANYSFQPHATEYKQSEIGDVSLSLGWQAIYEVENNDKNKEPMYFGFTVKGGVLFPTGDEKDYNYIFAIPVGYNDHWGINIKGQLDMWFTDWVKFTGYAGATLFIDKNKKNVPMKTHPKQQGWIRLARGEAEEEKGTLWYVGCDLMLDHIFEGFSLMVGYSYNEQEDDTLTPKDSTFFPFNTVNSDPLLHGWNMHALHLMAEYDFSVHMENSKFGPRISAFYNWPFDGENVFKTETFGGGVGIDIRWDL